MTQLPSRYVPTEAVIRRHGDRVERLGSMLLEGDPIADDAVGALSTLSRTERDALLSRAFDQGIDAISDAPKELKALFQQLEHVPYWFDVSRANRGGEALLRSGPLGGLVLGLKSLIGGYCSPAGNKPLVFSARLQHDVPRRLTETSRFVQLTAMRDGLKRGGPGFRATVRVRLMHAQVRRLLAHSPKWNADAWGLPINQYDMAGTTLLFSLAMIDGLRALGYRVSRRESEDMLHMWRYSGYLMGVREELLSTTEREANDLLEMIAGTEAPPDEDSRTLAHALLDHPIALARSPAERQRAVRMRRMWYAMSRHLIGDHYADHLGYPKTAWRFSIPAIRALIDRAESVRRIVPGADRIALRVGVRYWDSVVRAGEAGRPVEFGIPEALHQGAE